MTNPTPAGRPAAGQDDRPGQAARPRAPAQHGTLITVAPTGAESLKSAVPALPVTLDELVTTAKE